MHTVGACPVFKFISLIVDSDISNDCHNITYNDFALQKMFLPVKFKMQLTDNDSIVYH